MNVEKMEVAHDNTLRVIRQACVTRLSVKQAAKISKPMKTRSPKLRPDLPQLAMVSPLLLAPQERKLLKSVASHFASVQSSTRLSATRNQNRLRVHFEG